MGSDLAYTISERAGPNSAWAIFVPTIFSSACLLFFVQPVFAKMVLPLLGGAPAVWATAMLFFQSALIGGYAYAHFLSRHFGVSAQITIHLALWLLAATSLPLAVPEGWTFEPGQPVALQTLIVFAGGVGLPFFALSANAPLIQHWYAQLNVRDADNPYVLYGASNLGSLVALLAYPLLAEPIWGARTISAAWANGFWVLGLALAAAALLAARSENWVLRRTVAVVRPGGTAVGILQIMNWMVLAFIPSSLMLVVTTKISTDIGSLPLIWIIPLSLYLLSFVLVFTRRPLFGEVAMDRMLLAAVGLLTVAFSQLLGIENSLILAVMMILGFFATALWAHRQLYNARPDVRHLTLFYLIMSVGGALGGLFNSILAPWLFNDLFEGPLTLVVLLLIRIQASNRGFRVNKFALGAICAIGFFGVIKIWPNLTNVVGHTVAASVLLAASLAATALLWRNSYGLAVFLIGALFMGNANQQSEAILADRSFFGTHKVIERDGLRLYANGTTLHGSQAINSMDAVRPAPRAYYHRLAPMAQVMESSVGQTAERIGIVGLGVGALACYAQPGQVWDYYEIDEKVLEIARASGQFSFMEKCTPGADVHIGDARVVLQKQTDRRFDILVIDAYSSDAVPVHLTTQEAMSLYVDRLNDGGVLVMHISNRYYELDQPIVRAAASLGLVAKIQRYQGTGNVANGDRSSIVVVIARDTVSFGALTHDIRWQTITSDGGLPWTDDYANPLASLKILD